MRFGIALVMFLLCVAAISQAGVAGWWNDTGRYAVFDDFEDNDTIGWYWTNKYKTGPPGNGTNTSKVAADGTNYAFNVSRGGAGASTQPIKNFTGAYNLTDISMWVYNPDNANDAAMNNYDEKDRIIQDVIFDHINGSLVYQNGTAYKMVLDNKHWNITKGWRRIALRNISYDTGTYDIWVDGTKNYSGAIFQNRRAANGTANVQVRADTNSYFYIDEIVYMNNSWVNGSAPPSNPPNYTLISPIDNGTVINQWPILTINYSDPAATTGNVSFYKVNLTEQNTEDLWRFNNVTGNKSFEDPHLAVDENSNTYAHLTEYGVAGVFSQAHYAYIYENFTIPAGGVHQVNFTFKYYISGWSCTAQITFDCYDGAWTEVYQDSTDDGTIHTRSRILPSGCTGGTTVQIRTKMLTHDVNGAPSCDGDDEISTVYYEGRVKWQDNLLNRSENITNGTLARYKWSGLNDEITYDWFGVVTNGVYYVNSTTQNFTFFNITYNQSGPTSSKQGILHGFNLTLNASTKLGNINATFVFNGTEYGYDANTSNGRIRYFFKNFTMPLIGTTSVSYDWYWNYTIIDLSNVSSTTNQTVTVTQTGLDNCSTFTNVSLIFDLYNETGFINLTNESFVTELAIWFDYILMLNSTLITNYSSIMTHKNNYKFCIDPSNATFSVYATLEYGGDGFDTRTYYLINATLTNVTSVVYLYLIESALGSEITFTVQDANLVALEDTYVQIQRRDTGTGTYKTIAIGKTDNNGLFTTDIEKGGAIAYKFIVINKHGDVLDTISPVTFATTDTTYTITVGGGEIFNIYEDISYYCTYNNATRLFRCEVVDASGLMTTSRLIVERRITYKFNELCDSTETSSANVHTCTLTNNIDTYRFFIYANGVLIDSGTIKTSEETASRYGMTGLFIAMLMIMVMAFIGAFHPSISVFGATIGLIMAKVIGIITISETAIVGLVFVAGIIVLRMGMSKT